MARYVLSIDGGGIWGVVFTRILCEVEKRIQKPIGEVFDLFAGSSVGSVISAALSIKTKDGKVLYTASQVLELMLKHGPTLFTTSIIRKLFSIFSGARFSDANLDKVLHHFFGDMDVGSMAANFMAPSYDLNTGNTLMIRSWIDEYKELKVRDVLRAACAAPTVFTPQKLTINNKERVLIDSGVVANNPSVCAYAAADFLYPGEQVYVLSIGQGIPLYITPQSMYDKDVSVPTKNKNDRVTYGALFWISNIASIFLDAGMEAVDYQMMRIIGNEQYIRIAGTLQKASYDFTDASVSNIQALQEDAERIVLESADKIEAFVGAYMKK